MEPYKNFFIADIDGMLYFHSLLVICMCLISAWIPPLLSGCYRLLRPIVSALVAVVRKFAIFG